MTFDDILVQFITPTVSLDVISLVASSCRYYRSHIEPRAAHEFAVHVATQRRARETSTTPSSAVRSARCPRAGASLQTATADPRGVALIRHPLAIRDTPGAYTGGATTPSPHHSTGCAACPSLLFSPLGNGFSTPDARWKLLI